MYHLVGFSIKVAENIQKYPSPNTLQNTVLQINLITNNPTKDGSVQCSDPNTLLNACDLGPLRIVRK